MDIIENRDVVETDNGELVVDAVNDAPPPQDAPTTNTTMAAASEEGGDEDDVGAKDGKENGNETDYNKGGEEGGEILRPETATTKTTRTMTKRR